MSGEILQDFSCEFIHEGDSCKLVDFLVDENRKLREERDGWKKLCTDQEVMHVMREETLDNENDRLRELAQDIYSEYRYLRVRFHRTYVQHEERMRAIEQRMRELGVECGD